MKSSHIFKWVKILGGFFSLQLLVQAIAAIIGIIIVRTVDKHEYALYTITNAFLSSASNLADSGITIALTSIGGKLWQDRKSFGTLINTASSIRKWLTLVVIGGVVSTLPVMLFHNGATRSKIVSLTAILILSVLFQFGSGLYMVVAQLHANYQLLRRVSFYSTLLRAAMLAVAWLTLLNSITVVLMNAIAFAFSMWLYHRYARQEVDLSAKPDSEMRKAILRIIRRQVPVEIYSVLASQISIFLITLFGTSSHVADVGALSRIAMIFTAMNSVMANIVIPRFARCQEKTQLTGLFWKIILLFFATISSIIIPITIFSSQIMRLLGSQYHNLSLTEYLLAVIGSIVGTMSGTVWTMNSSRGWLMPSWIGIGVGIGAQIVGILLFNIRTVQGVLAMGLFTNGVILLLNLIASTYFLHRARNQEDLTSIHSL